MARSAAVLKSAFFTVIVPGTVAGLIPYLLVNGESAPFSLHLSLPFAAGCLMVACGALLGLWCVGLFTFVGKGTPAPIDPPKELVAIGPYRFVRNPMYVAVGTILLGEALCTFSLRLFIYTVVVCAAFHTFVTLYEEPTLRRLFGDSYEEYCRTVPRWLPKLPK